MLHLLQPVFDYFGAHTVPHRGRHERDRAVQRVIAGAVFTPVVFWFGGYAGLNGQGGPFPLFVLVPIAFGLSGLAYYFYLRARPEGGVLTQYLFLLVDPVVTVALIAYSPGVLTWWSVFLLAIIVRSGIRYGIRVLVLEWVVTGIGIVAIMGNAKFLQVNTNTFLTVASLVSFGVPLFIPLVRTLHRTRDLEVERSKIQALAKSVIVKSQFLSKVSHELKSPLQSIISTLDIFELRHEQPDDLKLIRRVRRAASLISTQLGDLLTLACGEAGSLSLRPKCVDVGALLAELCEQAAEVAAEKDLRLVVDLPKRPVVVFVDAVRLSQIAENLLTNAIKYTEQGTVTLRLQEYDARQRVIRFSVEDTGAGIAPEDRLVIFAPFERAKAEAYARDSAGIGLAVVQALLAYMGGNVTVISEVGKGSTFNVEVAAAGSVTPQVANSKGRVLVIDDRPDVLTCLVEVVTELGYTAESALTVGAASNLLAAHAYDAVMFDLQMPVKSGTELAIEIRRNEGPNRETRFIAMTASDESDAGRQWPFNDFLRKPIAARTLRRLFAAQPVVDKPPVV